MIVGLAQMWYGFLGFEALGRGVAKQQVHLLAFGSVLRPPYHRACCWESNA